MSHQKYDNGQQLYFIDFPGYAVYQAINKVYEPTTELYRINYRISGTDQIMISNVSERSLITLDEAMKVENSINKGLPNGFKDHTVATYIFVADSKFYVGTINFAGQWRDHNSEEFIHGVTHWLFRDGFADTGMGNSRFYNEGEQMDEPLKS